MSDHTTTTKQCSKCGEEKPATEFGRDKRKRDGLQYSCKECESTRARQWYEANREERAEYARAYRKANRERITERVRAWEKANPEKRVGYGARDRAKYPERHAARLEARNAVARGDFPPASALVCEHCQEAQAQEYHHHKGYSPEHALDVMALCKPCHTELDRRF